MLYQTQVTVSLLPRIPPPFGNSGAAEVPGLITKSCRLLHDIHRPTPCLTEHKTRAISTWPSHSTNSLTVDRTYHNMAIEKPVALVVGASRGIGRQVAVDLASHGYAGESRVLGPVT